MIYYGICNYLKVILSWKKKKYNIMWYRYSKAKYSDTKHSSVMIALFLPDEAAKKIVLKPKDFNEGSIERANALHITLAMLGEASELKDQKETIMSTLSTFASTHHPIEGKISGIGRFNSEHGDEPYYASCDAPNLSSLREALVDELTRYGISIATDHGFDPHITLGYLPAIEETPSGNIDSFDINFSCISIAWAGDRTDFEFKK